MRASRPIPKLAPMQDNPPMEGEVIRGKPSHVALADVLRRRIALGVHAPGDRLPSERELAERLGVGRTTVRAAIRLLADEGLLATSRGRSGGTVVLEKARPAGVELTREFIRDVRDNFDFRLAVEPLAARLAAERAESMHRWAIRGLAEGEAPSLGIFRALDSRFHLAIAEAAGNQLVLDAVRDSRAAFFQWADAAWERIDWDALPPQERDFARAHRPIAEAIAAGDGDAAARAMSEHLVEGRAMFTEILEGSGRRATASRG
jgi:GntR family transcriptional regulator, transcriptional repressor for pyruvate dehydrogenase complex